MGKTTTEHVGDYRGWRVIRTTRLSDGYYWDYAECPTCKCLNILDHCGVCHNKVFAGQAMAVTVAIGASAG